MPAFLYTPLSAIACLLIAALLAGAAPFLFEHGSQQWQGDILRFLFNPWIVSGMATYLTVTLFFTTAFRLGSTMRVLYPIYATIFIRTAVIAWLLHRDPIKPVHLLGMALLMTGIVLMSSLQSRS
jgi:uncharacterized membrane protein